MYTYADLESIASLDGYTPDARNIGRITATEVHRLHAGLVNSGSDDTGVAVVMMTKLRRWLLHGGNEPPPVRGAGFVRSDQQVWIAYTNHESPVLIRGSGSNLAELGRYLPMVAHPDYDGSLLVRTDPPIRLLASQDGVLLASHLGCLTLTRQAAQVVEQWVGVTVRPKDRRVVLCLPGAWTSS
ncbi:MAG: hypothetical protein OXL98_14515 [Acidimicrobiaceae bacterium]|nr:hypothetical protein [Acidimicrobiaceae bacterium]